MKSLFSKICRQWPPVATFLLFGLFCLAYIAVADTLTVTIDGAGSVNSAPAGIACTNGSSAGCSASFTNMSGITLTATPAWNSKPGVFSGACSGSPSCFFNISTNTAVTARFDPDLQAALIIVKPLQPEFSTLSDAYAFAFTNGNDNFNLNARVSTFVENLILNHPLDFTLAGGRNSNYYLRAEDGFTSLQGYLEVQNGSIAIDSLIIE